MFDFDGEIAKRDAERLAESNMQQKKENVAKQTVVDLAKGVGDAVVVKGCQVKVNLVPDQSRAVVLTKPNGDTFTVIVELNGDFAISRTKVKKDGLISVGFGSSDPDIVSTQSEIIREIADWCGF